VKMQKDGSLEVRRRVGLRVKDTPISIFQQFPNIKASSEFPYSFQDRSFVGTRHPILVCVDDAIVVSSGSSHDLGGLIPDFFIKCTYI